MAAARYITLLCLPQPYGHLSRCGFNERLLINTAFIFIFFLCHTRVCKLTYSAVCSLQEQFIFTLLILMSRESWVRVFSPQNISGAFTAKQHCLIHINI